jgi:rsbT co-antagonist protein RsbR
LEEQNKTKAQLVEELRAARELIAELTASEALLHDVLENAQAGIFTVDNAYHFTYVNEQLCEITGYAEEELIGQDFRFLLDEESRELTQERYQRRQRGEVLPSRYIVHIIRKDGERRTLEMSAAAGKDADGHLRTLGQVVDITQRLQAEAALRSSEERYRRMADNIQDGLTIIEGRDVVYLNDRVCEIFGHPRDELKHLSGLDIAAPEEKARIQALIEEAKAHGEPLESLMFWIMRPDGTRRYIHNRYSTTYDDEGVLLRFVVTTDMTERKRAEMEREQLQQEVIEAQREALKELSTPVIPVMERILVMPLVGSIDTMRARDIMRTLLEGISAHRAKFVILDVTGVPVMDTGVVNHINKTIQAARLKGAQTIVTGISDAVAEAVVDLGIDWGAVETLADLRTGLRIALNRMGIELIGS